ncbi:hypothetical protein DM53_2539 [Burkholderia mallei]|nr:hypothetical protein DM53_2539 [Burkholderia mallei]
MERVLHERLDSRVVGHVEPERDEARRVAAQHVRVARRREPLREPGGRIVPLDQRDDRRRIEKLLVHERGEIVGDLVLVLRNDLRVPRHERNRHAAKQRDHREPVGERAHHRRLRHRLDAVDPEAARREQRRREHARRGEQQRERAPLAVPEFPFLVVEHRDPVVSVSSRFRLVMHAAAPTAETSPSAERPRSRSLRRAHAARRRTRRSRAARRTRAPHRGRRRRRAPPARLSAPRPRAPHRAAPRRRRAAARRARRTCPTDAPVAPLRAVRPLEARHAGERAADVRAERDRAVEPLHERGEAKPGLRVAGRAEHGRRVAQRGETDRAATGRVRGGEPPGLEWRGCRMGHDSLAGAEIGLVRWYTGRRAARLTRVGGAT